MSENREAKQPTHDLSAYTPATKERATIGVAWVNEEQDNIRIKLKPGCSMSYSDQASIGVLYTLFKRRPFGQQPGKRYERDERDTPGDDDIPFDFGPQCWYAMLWAKNSASSASANCR